MTKKKRSEKRYAPNGIGWGALSAAAIAMAIVLILALLKIYLSNRIYTESKKLNKLQKQVTALRAERKLLSEKIETMRLRREVQDPIAVEIDAERSK